MREGFHIPLIGRVEDWRVGLGRSLFSPFLALSFASVTLSRPCHVSSPLHVARSMRISRTARPHLLRATAYGTYPAGAIQLARLAKLLLRRSELDSGVGIDMIIRLIKALCFRASAAHQKERMVGSATSCSLPSGPYGKPRHAGLRHGVEAQSRHQRGTRPRVCPEPRSNHKGIVRRKGRKTDMFDLKKPRHISTYMR
jgi:hypothetical protein